MSAAKDREVILIHSSDLHLGNDSALEQSVSTLLSPLQRVLATAKAAGADILLLAGDTFDNNRQSSRLLTRAARLISAFHEPVVILPGNHDPLTPDSVYRRAELTVASNLCVLGLGVRERVFFRSLGLEIRGRAHTDYSDMAPLSRPRKSRADWQIVAAHGHYVEKPAREHGSWQISRDELKASLAAYIALGHWIHAARVGGEMIKAYYSGSPEGAGTVNIVRLRKEGAVEVSRVPCMPETAKECQAFRRD